MYMVFAALLATPISAMLCAENLLPFFILFPLSSLIGKNWKYCKSLPFLLVAPAIFLIWAFIEGSGHSTMRSLRWICALTSGSYFASALGTAGIARVMHSFSSIPFAAKLSDLMVMAGSTVSNVRHYWSEYSNLPLLQRILQSAVESVSNTSSDIIEAGEPAAIPVLMAVVSWVFFLVSVSGIAGGAG